MVIDATDLSKNFGKKTVLNNFTISVGIGEIIGIIGPNGSGKTTLLNILIGLLKPTSGKIQMASNTKIGMSISRKGFFEDMSVQDNIKSYIRLLPSKDVDLDSLFDWIGVSFKQQRFGSLSAGMKQKVSLILAFLAEPDLVLLDEPGNHLDFDAILSLREMILKLSRKGSAFIITSHNLSDLEKICNRVIFIREGSIVGGGPLQDILLKYGSLEKAYTGTFK